MTELAQATLRPGKLVTRRGRDCITLPWDDPDRLLMKSPGELDAEQQSRRRVEAHERFSTLMDKQRYQVVYPVLPIDLLGIYFLPPE